MTDRCTIIPTGGGGYCLDCVEQPLIVGVPEHVDSVIVNAWNAGADMWDDTNDIPLAIDGDCEFKFTVPHAPVGVFMGFFNGAISRDRTDPASLIAIYMTTAGSSVVLQAYKYGSPFGSAQGVSVGATVKGQRVGNSINFLAAGSVFARTTIDPSITSCGACLFRSDDNIPDASFYALVHPPIFGGGKNYLTITNHGSQHHSYGRNSITITNKGKTGGRGRNALTITNKGNSKANYGRNTLSISSRGAGGIFSPHIQGGSNKITITSRGTMYHPSYGTGKNYITITNRGNTHRNYGSNRLTITNRGSTTVAELDDFIVAFMSPGISQMIFGYDVYTLNDGIDFADGLGNKLSILLRDAFALSGQIGTLAALHVIIRDGLGLSDKFVFKFIQTLSDAINLGDTLSVRQALILLDTLVLSGAVRTELDALCLMATTLTLGDALDKKFLINMDDTVALTGQLMTRWNATFELLDSMQFTETLVSSARITMLVPDHLDLGDSALTEMSAIMRMVDEIDFSIRVQIAGTVFVAWAMNTESKGATQYTNWPHNSYAQVGSRLFAGSDRGLFAASEGDDDDGENINAHIRTGLENLGSMLLKKLNKAYIGYKSNGDMLLRIEYTQPSGQNTVETYRAKRVIADDFVQTYVDVGKGRKAVYRAFELANEDGADFTLDVIGVIPLICGSRSNG